MYTWFQIIIYFITLEKGWWRDTELRKVHFAQEYNELHHLLIMETLGGDNRLFDRFFATSIAVLYYWFLVLFYMLSPRYF